MKGDFSTDRLDPSKHFNHALKQQGRVDHDSGWNEQAGIPPHLPRTLVVTCSEVTAAPVGHYGLGLTAARASLAPGPGIS